MIWDVIWLAVLMGGLGGFVRFIKALSSKIDMAPSPSLTEREHQDIKALPSKIGTTDQRLEISVKHDTSPVIASWYYEGQPLTKSIFLGNALRDSVLGMAGGLSLAGLAAALNVLDPDSLTTKAKIGFIVAYFVAGIAGRRVLDFATDKLMTQLSAAESQIARSQRSIEGAQEAIDKQKKELMQQSEDLKKQKLQLEDTARKAQRAQVITAATTQLMRGLPSELPGVVRELQIEQQVDPRDRTITILLGRAYRQMEKWDAAIGVLDDFLSMIKVDERVEDYADALYNRACYKALKAEKECGPGDERDHDAPILALVQDAMRDLRASVALLPANQLDAEKDNDFKYIKERFPREWHPLAEVPPKN